MRVLRTYLAVPAYSMGPVSRGADVSPPEKREEDSSRKVIVPEGKGWRQCWSYVGPGFLVAIAYIDPGNFESDLKAGAAYKFTLLWALLLASIAGLFIQSLSANLGIVTGKHLAQHCRLEYPAGLNVVLWLIAEINVIASDIPQGDLPAYSVSDIPQPVSQLDPSHRAPSLLSSLQFHPSSEPSLSNSSPPCLPPFLGFPTPLAFSLN
ncbi:unnamed protein product [Closterium sp. Yama58-4]|nr:unnamed protein product [Closterium sp. Yama58-4]